MLDLLAVLDAEGWTHASLLGADNGGSLCALFAASYPSRVDHLILHRHRRLDAEGRLDQ